MRRPVSPHLIVLCMLLAAAARLGTVARTGGVRTRSCSRTTSAPSTPLRESAQATGPFSQVVTEGFACFACAVAAVIASLRWRGLWRSVAVRHEETFSRLRSGADHIISIKIVNIRGDFSWAPPPKQFSALSSSSGFSAPANTLPDACLTPPIALSGPAPENDSYGLNHSGSGDVKIA